MYRIDNATAVPSSSGMPAPAAPGPRPNGYFTKGNRTTPVAATIVDDDWLNCLQEEICTVIAAAAITLHKSGTHDLLDAIRFLINQIFPVTIARGGTNKTSFSPGSVVFAGQAGTAQQLTEDVGAFYWDAINNRLGIGTNAPTANLTVYGSGHFSQTLNVDTAGAFGTTLLIGATTFFGYSGQFYAQPAASPFINWASGQYLLYDPALGFILNTTQSVQLNAPVGTHISHALFVGTTGDFGGDVTATNVHAVSVAQNAGLTATGPSPLMELVSTVTGNTWVQQNNASSILAWSFNTTGRMTLDQFGNLVIQGAYSPSDASLKRDVVEIDDALSVVERLRPVRYVRKETGTNEIGFIAQDVRNVVPEVVREGEDGLLSLNYANMGAVSIAAIKSLIAENKRLSERLSRLEAG